MSPAAMQERSESLSIFFARIPPTVAVEELMALFKQYGRVVNLNLFRRWATARTSKGCGVVTYTHHAAAAAALEALNGKTLHFSNSTCAEVVVEWVDDDKVAKTINAQAVSRNRKAGKASGANDLEQRVLGNPKQLPDPFGSCTQVCWNALVVPRPAGARHPSPSFTASTSYSSSLQDEANRKASLPIGETVLSSPFPPSTGSPTFQHLGDASLWVNMPMTPDAMLPTSPLCEDAMLAAGGAGFFMAQQQQAQVPQFQQQQQHQQVLTGASGLEASLEAALCMHTAALAADSGAALSCSAACMPGVAAAAMPAAGSGAGVTAAFPGPQERLTSASNVQLGISSFASCMGSPLSLGVLEAPPMSGAAARLVQQQLNVPSRAVDTISLNIPGAHVCNLAGLMNTMAGMTNTRMALEASGSSGFLLCVTGAPENLLTALQLLDAVLAL